MNENFLRGGLFMLLGTVLFSLSDTMAKYITQGMPAVELATIRYAVFVAMACTPLLRKTHAPMFSRRPWLQILRGLCVVGSALFFILSLGSLPIAEATALNFVTPLLITVLAIPVLGESVRPAGWVAVLVGFLGMLIVVRPGVGGFHAASGLVLLSSLCWCVAMLVTRKLVTIDRSSVTLLWTACTGLLLLLCLLPFFLQPLSGRQVAVCLAVGVVASGGQWLAVLAYRNARATALAPLTYAQLIWSSVLGTLVFRHAPDRWVVIGAIIIATSGLAVVHMERLRAAAERVRQAAGQAAAP